MRDAAGAAGTGSTPFWAVPEAALLAALGTTHDGLPAATATARAAAGDAAMRPTPRWRRTAALALTQVRSPIVLLLLGAAGLSLALGDTEDTSIILVIVVASAGLGFWQEHRAADAVAALLATVRSTATVLRDGRPVEVPFEAVVPGDVVTLTAGDRVPGDCRLLDARDLHAVEAALTGETFPVEKEPGVVAADAPAAGRTNALFLGTHVASGTGRAVVAAVGAGTEYGAIARRLQLRAPETEFERGVRRFGALLAEVTLLLVLGIFAANVALDRPVLDALLFALALAVGLTPQLLPAIISVNLAHGARRLARERVIVKRLAAIENLGSMDVLCCDKTGTLTEGAVRLDAALGPDGAPSDRVRRLAGLNAALESGFRNPIDEAVRAAVPDGARDATKLDELPYDFLRKRLSVLAAVEGRHLLVTKGAVPEVLAVCTTAADGAGTRPLADVRDALEARFTALGRAGLRALAVAVRDVGGAVRVSRADEADMTFVGFVTFADPPKAGVADRLTDLRRLGVRVTIVTGDARVVAESVAQQVGMAAPRVVTGPALRTTSDEALRRLAPGVDVFAEVAPNQKERLVRALQQAGHVVGFLGDGINDASALHAADVGLSVAGAVDVAREAADFVLLDRDLGVLAGGIREGRRTFANTLKYVFMATSANFGNMFSMAGASVVLPFLPLLPKQILLTNLLTDLPEMAIGSDRVDPEWIARPRRWDVRYVRDFMLAFGLLSSCFDYATFATLRLLLHAGEAEFRTGWFVESVLSAALVVLVIRTRGPAWQSPPGTALTVATLGVMAATLALPWTPLATPLGFVPLEPRFLAVLAAILATYVCTAELLKRWFHSRPHGTR